MILLVLKISVWLLVAAVLGWWLRGYRFSRQFLEVSDSEMSDLQGKIARLESENGDFRMQLSGQTERARSAESKLEVQKSSLNALERRNAELQTLAAEGDARVDAALQPVQLSNAQLNEELRKRGEELKSVQNRLSYAEATIKRKTELLRLSETDPAKAAKLSWRPPDSSRPSSFPSIAPAGAATRSSPSLSAPDPKITPVPPSAPALRSASIPAPTRFVPSRPPTPAPPSVRHAASSAPPNASRPPSMTPVPRPSSLPPRPPTRSVRPAPAVPPALLSTPDRGAPDALQRLSGVSAELEASLNALGLYYYFQFADWSPEQVAYVEQRLVDARGKAARWSAEVPTLQGEIAG